MELIYKKSVKNTKRAVSRLNLNNRGWSAIEHAAFQERKHILSHQVTLKHRDTSQRFFVYTDGRNDSLSGIYMYVPLVYQTLANIYQQNLPLAYLNGRFKGSLIRWPILKKKGYAIMDTLERFHWLAAIPSGFNIYIYHHNITNTFDLHEL